jgi:hypothetical protein
MFDLIIGGYNRKSHFLLHPPQIRLLHYTEVSDNLDEFKGQSNQRDYQ